MVLAYVISTLGGPGAARGLCAHAATAEESMADEGVRVETALRTRETSCGCVCWLCSEESLLAQVTFFRNFTFTNDRTRARINVFAS